MSRASVPDEGMAMLGDETRLRTTTIFMKSCLPRYRPGTVRYRGGAVHTATSPVAK